MKPISFLFLTVLSAALLVACKPSVPSEYIQPDDMEDLLVDYHLAQAMAQQQDGSYEESQYRRELYLDAVLKKHGITRADFDSSLVYYYIRADRFQKIYKRVADQLSEQALAMGTSQSEIDRYATLSANGDTANVWADRTEAVLTPYAPYNRFDFSIDADTTFRKGDSFMLSFQTDYLYQSGSKTAVAHLTVTYDNDSIVSNTSHISVSGTTQLRVAAINDLTVKKIRGFIYLSPGSEKTTTLRLMLLSHMHFIKFRRQESKDEPQAKDSLVSQPLKGDTLRRDSLRRDTTHRGALRRIIKTE